MTMTGGFAVCKHSNEFWAQRPTVRMLSVVGPDSLPSNPGSTQGKAAGTQTPLAALLCGTPERASSLML
jgi:hypothetical protein